MKVLETDPKTLIFTITHLLNSLLDSISQTQCFKSKWTQISSKIITLQSSFLSSDRTNNTFLSNPLAFDLLHSLSLTLSDTLSLSTLCHAPTPPHGKLKTQNEIDSVSAKLDCHIKDIEVIVKSGVLLPPTGTGAVSGSSSSSSSSKRESVRAEFRKLITRLQIGSTESKNSVLDSVLSLLQEDDKNVLFSVAQGIVPVLVRLLDSSSHHSEIKEKTVVAVAKIAAVDSVKHVLIAEGLGLLNNLLRVLESGSVFAKEKACIALQALSQNKESARAIGSRGGISSLLEICNCGTPNSQAIAAGVLRDLSVFHEIKENFLEENGVTILLGLLKTGKPLSQENAIGCLNNLIKNDEDLKLFVAREGVIDSLTNYWDLETNLEVAIVMVQILASNPIIGEVLVSKGFLDRVSSVLSGGVLGSRIAGAKAVCELAYNNKTRKELGEIGCILPLVNMMDGKGVEEKEAAAKALSILMSYPGNRRIFRKEEKGIVSAVNLLDPMVQNLDKKYPIAILSSIVHSRKCKKQMVAYCCHIHLQKLVELNVEGAKKLLESTGKGGGKLWRVFART